MSLRTLRLLALALGTAIALPGFAAGPLTAAQTLNQLNVVALNTINSNSHVDGRTWAGGAVFGGDYGQHPGDAPASAYAGLTAATAASVHVNGMGAYVAGSLANSIVNAGSTVVMGSAASNNFNGPAAYVAGASASNNFNGGGRVYSLTGDMQAMADAASSTNFANVLGGLSQSLKTAGDTGGSVDISGNKVTFNAVAGSDGVAVFDLTAIDETVFAKGEFEFNLNGASTMVFNTDVSSASIAANFLGGSAQAIGGKTIWNFYNASTLNINNQFGGSILALGATLTNWNNIEGGVFVEDLVQRGEIHLQPFEGVIPVPEPEAYGMLLAGLALVGVFARRRSV